MPHQEITFVPLIGTVAAGQPILAQENIEEYFPLPKNCIHDADSFILRVKGNSMIKMGMFDGDLVIVEPRNTAENGEVIVALVGDSATVKRFYKENGHYRLQPENDNMKPIIVREVQILGKVTGLFRMMS